MRFALNVVLFAFIGSLVECSETNTTVKFIKCFKFGIDIEFIRSSVLFSN